MSGGLHSLLLMQTGVGFSDATPRDRTLTTSQPYANMCSCHAQLQRLWKLKSDASPKEAFELMLSLSRTLVSLLWLTRVSLRHVCIETVTPCLIPKMERKATKCINHSHHVFRQAYFALVGHILRV